MFKKSAVAAALLLVSVASKSFALGLGEIDMQSALNQPMRAVIELTSAAGTDLSQVKVSIASTEAHQRAGLTRSRILSKFRFKVEQDNRGQAVIRISSTDTIHEPFLEFMLELSWSNGRLMRQYTVLVDPPLTMPAAPAIPATPVSSAPGLPLLLQNRHAGLRFHVRRQPPHAHLQPAAPVATATAATDR
jgi:pilus assembly protein FimV